MSLMCRVRRRVRSSSWTTSWGVLRLDAGFGDGFTARFILLESTWGGRNVYVRFLAYRFDRAFFFLLRTERE